jgi:acyl-CoA thioester hydrolase
MHKFSTRVYYEDTDAQGVIYYANYLKFIERARTEYLRTLGYKQNELLESGLILMVRKVKIDYLLPVSLDETIRIETKLIKVKKLSFDFLQTIYNESGLIVCKAEVFCCSINAETKKPELLPSQFQQKMLEEIN